MKALAQTWSLHTTWFLYTVSLLHTNRLLRTTWFLHTTWPLHAYRFLHSWFYIFMLMCIRYGHGDVAGVKEANAPGSKSKKRRRDQFGRADCGVGILGRTQTEFPPMCEELKQLAREPRGILFLLVALRWLLSMHCIHSNFIRVDSMILILHLTCLFVVQSDSREIDSRMQTNGEGWSGPTAAAANRMRGIIDR